MKRESEKKEIPQHYQDRYKWHRLIAPVYIQHLLTYHLHDHGKKHHVINYIVFDYIDDTCASRINYHLIKFSRKQNIDNVLRSIRHEDVKPIRPDTANCHPSM